MGVRDRRHPDRPTARCLAPGGHGAAELWVRVCGPGDIVCTLAGMLDLAAAGQLVNVIEAIIDYGFRTVLLDLTAATAVAPAAICAWSLLGRWVACRGGAIAVLALAGRDHLAPLRLAVGDAMPVFTSRRRALSYLHAARSRGRRPRWTVVN